jgi:HK97 family phage prohead protease
MSQYKYRNLDLSFKDADVKQGIVTGYFAAFNVVDAYKEVLLPTAVTKTIAEQGPTAMRPRIKHLLNHDVTRPIGKLTELKADDFGLYYASKVGTNDAAIDFVKMVESELITEHSIGYREMKTTYDSEAKILTLNEIKLFEGSSLSGWGVNEFTPLLGFKGDTAARIKKLEAFCRNTDCTDETIELLLLEIRQLEALIVKAYEAPAPDESTQAATGTEIDAALISQFINIKF